MTTGDPDPTASTGASPPLASPATRAEAASERRIRHRRRRLILTVAAAIVVLIVGGVSGFLVVKASSMTSKVFAGGGGVAGLVGGGAPLATGPDGRVNILIFGTSQDDAAHSTGSGGQGMWLTDSIQLLSINPVDHTAVMVAVPRDTWVKLGNKCVVGAAAKVNAVYECATGVFDKPQAEVPDYQQTDATGARALMAAVNTVTGIQPQYWVHINYTVLRTAVDAVGGIDVEIVGNGHEGIFDTNADGGCPHEEVACRAVYYPRDGIYRIDGTHALSLARARGDGNPRSCMQFGLNGGDFDRQANQQKITVALKNRAVSAGTLANPAAVSGLIDALGDNVTTNLSTDEAKTAISLAREMGDMTPISLVDPAHPVMTTGTVSGQSVVHPLAGTFDYSAIHRFIDSRIHSIDPTSTATATATATSSGSATSAGPAASATPSTSAAADPTSSAKSTYERPASCWER
ncbi:MAG TPA: LCP family protein [Dermatophilaceae bacterium]|jgi:anionic cell wall polymer biosynthesis LytR-Cps2A-Psr (LCP) family protein|nr:LCP family protein [Dermatophilaceae bacterium]HOA02202.1 LCP family protein [Dermatophilaceae bacterium]HOR16058.1 LCP family protein [Dermatophilaceae bacterium]HPK89639.1 LCP family protein [Dermatophilaceae bacterium]HPV79666.1 LCP family protein [Dermatophilaceae bacterium]